MWRDRVSARDAGDAAAALLGAAIGVACRLVWLDDPRARPVDPGFAAAEGDTVSFADGFPVLLTTDASLASVNAELASPIPATRFRPNLVVAGATPWAEDGWRRIRVGEVAFAVAKYCERCIVTTIDPETGLRPDHAEPLRTLARLRRTATGGVTFGQNLIPASTGAVAVGDEVEVLA